MVSAITKDVMVPRRCIALFFLASLSLGAAPAKAVPSLINGGFEDPAITDQLCTQFPSPPCYALLNESGVPGWDTTATDKKIEIWTNGFLGVPAYEGSQFAELNANEVSTLFQDVTGIQAGSIVGYEFAHRGRLGDDTLALTITDLGADNILGGGNDTVLFTNQYTSGNSTWGFYSDPSALTAIGNTMRFAYTSVSAAGGNQGNGNFLDAVKFGVGVGETPAVPGPLPLFGASTAFAFSRRLRRRIRQSRPRFH